MEGELLQRLEFMKKEVNEAVFFWNLELKRKRAALKYLEGIVDERERERNRKLEKDGILKRERPNTPRAIKLVSGIRELRDTVVTNNLEFEIERLTPLRAWKITSQFLTIGRFSGSENAINSIQRFKKEQSEYRESMKDLMEILREDRSFDMNQPWDAFEAVRSVCSTIRERQLAVTFWKEVTVIMHGFRRNTPEFSIGEKSSRKTRKPLFRQEDPLSVLEKMLIFKLSESENVKPKPREKKKENDEEVVRHFKALFEISDKIDCFRGINSLFQRIQDYELVLERFPDSNKKGLGKD
ncbi:MAG: hypothetical protein UX67_C0032G0003 [Candidatus Woesebacteria bacterium GW2011_GWF2_46_8]|uniref:Uncharacterized protein n=1 Tax=Candidatus Woesebacteria bacterium GW2011_GWF2_46_8 TaxID=1618604 RepID=A0A0G1QRV8_9BACT|nr:MAG: hypothetical protein UX67_C0032G0003 [Candidatus Woesebacteria bacterium GW2011_GWF2_46_8]